MFNKTTKTILFASLIVAMILPFSVMDFADAEKADKIDKDKKFEKVEKHNAKIKKQLVKADQDKIHEKVKKDKKTSKHFKNKSVINNGYSYFGNIYELEANPDKKLDIVMHYTIDDKTISVLVDGETEEVIESQVRELQSGLLPDNGLVISGYSSNTPINGMRMDYNAPNFSSSGVGWTAMLVNTAKNGSVTKDVCDEDAFPTTYWAQSGIQMASGGMDLIWADTETECHQQYFTTNPTQVDAGDYVISQITVTDSNDLWVMYGYNVDNGNFWAKTKTVSGSTDFRLYSGLTNVFFENPNDTSEIWDNDFSADPKINKAYAKKVSNGAWDYWPSQSNFVVGCDPGGYNWSEYASGSLSGSGVTYDVNDIQQYCGVS